MKNETYRNNIIVSLLKNFKFNSIFFRILSITFSAFLIFCIITFVGIRVQTQQAMKNEITNSNFYVDYSYSYIKKLVQKLDEYMYSIEYDSNVVFIRTLPKDSNYAQNHLEVTNIFKRLSIFRLLVNEVTNVYIYFPNIDRIMTSQGEYEPRTLFKLNYKGNYDEWMNLLTHKYLYTLNTWNFDTSPGNFSNLNLIKSFYDGQGAKSVIVANLDRDLIKKLFEGNDYASNRNIYLTDKNMLILSSNISGQTGKVLDIDYSIIKKAEEGSFYNNKYLISYRYLPENNIYFVVMTPKEVMLKNVHNLTYAAYIFLAIMLIAGLILSVFLSQWLYLPIGQMLKDMERLATASTALRGRENEYEYIENNINIIYTNNKKLENIIQQSIPFILDIIVMKLMSSQHDIGNAALLASQYNIEFKKGNYIITVVKCTHSYINMSQKMETDLTILVKKHIASDMLSVLKVKDDELAVVIFIETEEQTKLVLDHLAQLSAELDEIYEDENFYFGLGDKVDNFYSINTSYLNAQKALNERKVQDNEKVFIYNPAGLDKKESKTYIPVDFEERYKNALHAGNIEIAEDLIYEILDHNYLKNITFQAYFKLSNWLLNVMERVIDNSSDDMSRRISKELLENVDTAGDIVELNERIVRNNRLLCTAYLNEKKSDTNFLKIMKFVDSNFCKSINLDAVANHFGYNSSYLSRLFKQIKGISFSDYLSKKRIEFAKKQLEAPGKTIQEIAEESGYNSTGIFIKAFEKAEGVTPGEFRKRK